jgi:hypothetical protein
MSKHVADDLGARFGPPLHTCGCRRYAPTTPSPRARSAPAPTPRGTPPRRRPHAPCSARSCQSERPIQGHGGTGGLLTRLHGRPLPADIRGGALLGDVIGDYFLITRNGVDPQHLM